MKESSSQQRQITTIGLCGEIGAGKSTVAEILEELGCRVFSSDKAGHALLNRPEVAEEIRSWWGAGLIGPDGGVDRGALADRIFEDSAARERVETLLHPLIAGERATMIASASSDPAVKAVVLDSPLLFEAYLDRECDVVIFVQASFEQRLARVSDSRNWNADELARRAAAQMSPEEKRRRSDFVIDNEGSRETLNKRIADVLSKIL